MGTFNFCRPYVHINYLATQLQELRTQSRLGETYRVLGLGDYVGFWGGPITRYITNLVQGSHEPFGLGDSPRVDAIVLFVVSTGICCNPFYYC